jgi:hypothetical protein
VVAGLVAVVALSALAVVWAAGVGGGDDHEKSPRATASAGAFPEGVYRYRLNAHDVLQIVPGLEQRFLKDAVGTFTWTIRDGTMSLSQTSCTCSFPRVTGSYTVDANRLIVHWPKLVSNGVAFCTGDCTDTVRWGFDGKSLRLEPISGDRYDIVFWGAGKAWLKIG